MNPEHVDRSRLPLPTGRQVWPALCRYRAAGLACLLTLVSACDRGPGETHPGPAFISGVVFEDLDGNGVQDDEETGLGGVVVMAEEAGSDGGGFSNSAGTDGSGYYSMELAGSVYQLFVDPDSLPAGYILTSEPAQYTLSLPDGREESFLNFGYRPP